MRIASNLRTQPKNVSIRLIRAMQKAIKEHCYRCMNIPPTPRTMDCELEDCPLYEYRPWGNR